MGLPFFAQRRPEASSSQLLRAAADSFSLREERAEEVQRFLLASKARLDLPDSNGATRRHFEVSRLCVSC